MIGRKKLKINSETLVGHLRAFSNHKKENHVEARVEPR